MKKTLPIARIAFSCAFATALALTPNFSDAQRQASPGEYEYFDKGDDLSHLFQVAEEEGGVDGLKISLERGLSEEDALDYDIRSWSDLTVTLPEGESSSVSADSNIMLLLDFDGIKDRKKILRMTAKYGILRMLTRQDGNELELEAVGSHSDRGFTQSNSLLLNGESVSGADAYGLPNAGAIASRMREPVAFGLIDEDGRLTSAAHAGPMDDQTRRDDPAKLLDPFLFLRLLFAGYSQESVGEHGISESITFDAELCADSASALSIPYEVKLTLKAVYGDNDEQQARAADYDVTLTPKVESVALDPMAEDSLRYAPASFSGALTLDVERGIVTEARLDGSYPEGAAGLIAIKGTIGYSIALRVKQDDSSADS